MKNIIERSRYRRNVKMAKELLEAAKSTEAYVKGTDALLLELLRETQRSNLIALAGNDLLTKEERLELLAEVMPESFSERGNVVE